MDFLFVYRRGAITPEYSNKLCFFCRQINKLLQMQSNLHLPFGARNLDLNLESIFLAPKGQDLLSRKGGSLCTNPIMSPRWNGVQYYSTRRKLNVSGSFLFSLN